MFGIGFGEIIVILIIAIIFFNPKDLPKIAYTVGKWYSKIKVIYNDVKTIKDKTMNIIENELYFSSSDDGIIDDKNKKDKD